MSSILLADGRQSAPSEILGMYQHEEMYGVFAGSTLFVDRITASNVLEIKPLPYRQNDSGMWEVQNPDSLEWSSLESLADGYNCRTGKYAGLYCSRICSSADMPMQIRHLNGSVQDCSPPNLTRTPADFRTVISIDYYRSLCHAKSSQVREYASELYPLISMKRQYSKYIEKPFYESHSHDYLSMPCSWNFLSSLFGSTDSINKTADHVIRENSQYTSRRDKFDRSPNAMSVYIASDTSTEDGKRLTAFMESFLDGRGYKVISPSRDIRFSYLADSGDDPRSHFCRESRRHLAECDLLIVCSNTGLGCFAGNTTIRLACGETARIADMRRTRAGYPILVYSQEQGKFDRGFTYGSVMTGRRETAEVILDTHESVRCTPDHPFLTAEGMFEKAADLKPGTALVSVYQSYTPKVLEVRETGETEEVFGIECLGDSHAYVLSAGGIVVRNSSLELGMKAGLWIGEKLTAHRLCAESLDMITERDLAVLNQTRPRIVRFSDRGECQDSSAMESGMILRNCRGWDELKACLDYIDSVGVRYAQPDPAE